MACQKLALDETYFETRINALDAYLDSIEEALTSGPTNGDLIFGSSGFSKKLWISSGKLWINKLNCGETPPNKANLWNSL